MLQIPKKTLGNIILHATALVAPVTIFAAPALVPEELSQTFDIVAVVQAAIRFILLVAFVLAFIFLLIGGIRWIVAGGDEKGVAGARGMITAALIGLVIILVSYAIIRLVEVFFNVQVISGETVIIPTIGEQIER